MILVDVPTSGTSPPSKDMNDIGISSADGELCSDRPIRTATGINVASAPTLLVSMERRAVAAARTETWLHGRFS